MQVDEGGGLLARTLEFCEGHRYFNPRDTTVAIYLDFYLIYAATRCGLVNHYFKLYLNVPLPHTPFTL